ncbi:MAG: hypothetical protein R2769_03365 [Saprospiraceae bacterium]
MKPNCAIVTDVTHDTQTPMIKQRWKEISRWRRSFHHLCTCCTWNIKRLNYRYCRGKREIPIQRAAASRSTGTDTDAFAYSNGGVPSALISLPLRYMHTTVEMAHKDDVNYTIRLIYETLLKIKPGMSFKYFDCCWIGCFWLLLLKTGLTCTLFGIRFAVHGFFRKIPHSP